MKTPMCVFACAMLSLSGCNTMYGSPPPPPGPVGPVGTGAPVGNATLTTATRQQLGTYVVDGSGRAVYVLEGTRGASGINRCSGQCLNAWPPMNIDGTPGAAAGLNQQDLHSVSGFTGSQVTYSGWPLYYYSRDQAPGDTYGQGVRDQWGSWYLIRPTGDPIMPRY